MRNFKNESQTEKCPDEVSLIHYIFGHCSPKERHAIEEHLAQCPLCRREVIFLIHAQSEIQNDKTWGKLPDQLYDRMRALIKGKLKKATSD